MMEDSKDILKIRVHEIQDDKNSRLHIFRNLHMQIFNIYTIYVDMFTVYFKCISYHIYLCISVIISV